MMSGYDSINLNLLFVSGKKTHIIFMRNQVWDDVRSLRMTGTLLCFPAKCFRQGVQQPWKLGYQLINT